MKRSAAVWCPHCPAVFLLVLSVCCGRWLRALSLVVSDLQSTSQGGTPIQPKRGFAGLAKAAGV
jgi:hypothetical protein